MNVEVGIPMIGDSHGLF